MVLLVEEWFRLKYKYHITIIDRIMDIDSGITVDDFRRVKYLIDFLEINKKIDDIRIGGARLQW